MAWDRQGSQRELSRAVRDLDARRVAELCGELVAALREDDEPYPAVSARAILGALRSGRHVAHVEQVAEAFLRAGSEDPTIRRHHAQALLDEGHLIAAEAVLERLVAQTGTPDAERAEARGLLGRAYKDMYLATGHGAPERRRAVLERAIAAYRDVYAESPQARWHGINAVALLARAARDGIALDGEPDPAATALSMAAEILAAIDALGDADAWDQASAMQACVALGRPEPALERLDAFLAGADAFAIAGTLRQLVEVWELDPAAEPGARLIPVLQAALLDHDDTRTDVLVGGSDIEQAAGPPDPGFQKVLGTERFESLKWFRTALDRCRAVARIEDASARPVGTGFLVDGPALHAAFPPLVLVTNAHVVGTDSTMALDPGDARVTFRALETDPQAYRVARVLWTSPPGELDTTIAELDAYPAGAAPCPVATKRPALDGTPPPQTYVIGHPSGWDQVMLSVRDNQVLDGDEVRLHYRTPTEGGSSGSPVFNRAWEVIALHHAGAANMPRLHGAGGTYPANEGIWLDCVAGAISL